MTYLVFHNGKPVYGFNSSSHTLETYIQFIHNNTGIKHHQSIPIELIQEDYKGRILVTRDDFFLVDTGLI